MPEVSVSPSSFPGQLDWLDHRVQGVTNLRSTENETCTAEFESYDITSQNYDGAREQPGFQIVLGSLQFSNSHDVPLDKQRILDVGCGTGNAITGLVPHVGHVHGVEPNAGMLDKARAKFYKSNKVTLDAGDASKLKFHDNTFHGAMMNQVAHHFDHGGNYQALRDAFAEISRVLQPGGLFVMNTCLPEQHRDGYWWAELFSGPDNGTERYMKRFAPRHVLISHLRSVGFEVTDASFIVPTEPLMKQEVYADYQKALTKPYRDCDSSWAIADPAQLEAALQMLQGKIDDGTADEWFQSREHKRQLVGQSVYVIAKKSD